MTTDEPEPRNEDAVYDGCVALCNALKTGTALDLELVAAGIDCYKIRQLFATETSETKVRDPAQANTPTLPGYSKAELKDFKADPTLRVFRELWDRQRKPSYREKLGFTRPMPSLLKQWSQAKEKEGLLNRVIDEAHFGKCFQLPLPAQRTCSQKRARSYGTSTYRAHPGFVKTEMFLGKHA